MGKDTTITTRWKNGVKKSERTYSFKRYHDLQKRNFIVLGKLKSEKYYNSNGQEVSESDIFFLECREARDSLRTVERNQPAYIPRCRIAFPLRNLVFNVELGDSGQYSYQKKDTLIAARHYHAIVYVADSLSPDPGRRLLLGAFRNTPDAVWFYDFSKNNEEPAIDLTALLKEFAAPAAELTGATIYATYQAANQVSRIVRSGTEKSGAFVLGNLIMLFAR